MTDVVLRRIRDVLVSLACLSVSVLILVYLVGAWSLARDIGRPVPEPTPTVRCTTWPDCY